MFVYNLTKKYGLSWLFDLFGQKLDDTQHANFQSLQDQKTELETLASDYMAQEQWKDTATAYGINLEEASKDLPLQESPCHDDYYTTVEKERYEHPKPSLNTCESWGIRWQKGHLLGQGSFGSVRVVILLCLTFVFCLVVFVH